MNSSLLVKTIDLIPSPVFYKNIKGEYEECNEIFSDIILGIPKDEIIGKTLFELPEYIPHELAHIYKEQDDKLFNNPGTQIYESDVKCKDGLVRRYKFHKSTVFDDEGRLIGLLGVMLDITENYQMQLELKEKNRQLEAMATIDSLTQIYNRRKLDEILQYIWEHNKRGETQIGMLMIDIDNFKLFNDTYGHQKGDEALTKVAQLLLSCIRRKVDYVARYGGEEFVIVIDKADKNFMHKISEDVLSSVRELKIKHAPSRVQKYLTVSVGATIVSPFEKDASIHSFIAKADKMLYSAKNNGRNRVEYSF